MKAQSLTDQIAAAQVELDKLAAERLQIPELLREASAKGDATAIVKFGPGPMSCRRMEQQHE